MFATLSKPITRFIARFEQLCDHLMFLPSLALLAALDLFVLVIPTDGLVISATLLRPRRWLSMALVTALGSALGALLLATLIRWRADEIIALFFERALQSPSWIRTETFIEQHGPWALGIIALSPLPQQPAVILTALTHVSLTTLFFSVFVGRMLKFVFFTWSATHAPRLLSKFTGVRKELGKIESERTKDTL